MHSTEAIGGACLIEWQRQLVGYSIGEGTAHETAENADSHNVIEKSRSHARNAFHNENCESDELINVDFISSVEGRWPSN